MAAKARASEQVHRHGRVRVGVVGGIADPTAAVERVGPEAAGQRVAAGAAVEQVGVGVAGELVRVGRAGDVAEVGEGIAGRRATVGKARSQVDRDLGRGVGIVERIRSDAAIEAVGAGAALQRVGAIEAVKRILAAGTDDQVVAQAAIDQVGIAVAGQPVRAVGPGEVADTLQTVALRIAARTGSCAQIDGHREAGGRVVGGIDPAAADKRVGPTGTRERVVGGAAVENVAVGVATQRIHAARTGDGKDALQQVARRVTACSGPRAEVDRHGEARVGIVDKVRAAATRQRVGAEVADQRVVVAAAVQPVVVVIADEQVGPRRADDIADADQDIALRVAADSGPRRQVDRHGLARRGVDRRVGAAAADQGVAAARTDQGVGAGPAIDDVAVAVARERVVLVRAAQVGQPDQHVTLGVAAGPGVRSEVHRDARARTGVVRRVCPAAADQRVGAEAAGQRILAGAAIQQVVVGIARDLVVAAGADHVGDGHEQVAGRIAAEIAGTAEIDRDRPDRAGIVHGVRAATALQRIAAEAALERVVSLAAIEYIGVAITGDYVRSGRTDDVADRDEHVALGVAADRAAIPEVQRDALPRGRVVGRIDAATALQRIGADRADQRVVIAAAIQQVGIVVTRQPVRTA